MGYRIRNKRTKPILADGIYGKRVKTWAIGITICPRLNIKTNTDESTYTKCIDSLLSAGWNTCHLFCEPETKLEDRHSKLPQTHRKTKFGAWKNFLYSLTELIEAYPNADCYGMIQDDIIFCKGIRLYLENNLWPSKECGLVSIYTPSHYSQDKTGWYKMNRGASLWGACTFFFPANAAQHCVNNKFCKNWHA